MPSIKIELLKSKVFADGKHPVYIRVTHSGRQIRKMIATSTPADFIGLPEKCLKGTTSAIRQLNIDIEDEYTKYQARFKELVRSENDWKPEDVFAIPDTTRPEIKTFWEIADLYASQFTGFTKAGQIGKIKKFKAFAKNDSLHLNQIDSQLIDSYMHFMRTTPQRSGKVNKEGTVKSNIKSIRFVSNFASRNGYDVSPASLHDFKLPGSEPAATEYLTEAELLKFASVELDGPFIKEAQQAFLLAIYLRGMRIGDIIQLKQSAFSNGRLKYTTGKTGEVLEMALVPKAQAIIDSLADDREYLFHFFRYRYEPKLSPSLNDDLKTAHIKAITANINNKLKKIAERAGIKKNIRTHIARHSFSNILDGAGIDLSIIQGLLGHKTRAMTEKYIKKIRKSDVLDEAVKGVFG